MPTTLPNTFSSAAITAAANPFSKLLRRLLGGFVAIGLIMVAVFGLISWGQENRDMRENLAIQAGFAAQSSQAVFDDIGNGMELLGRLLERLDVVHNPEVSRHAFAEFQASHPGIDSMALIGTDGTMFLNSAVEPGKRLPDLRKDDAYMRALKFDENTTDSYTIGTNQEREGRKGWYFPFRHVVRDSSGNSLFVIEAAISAANTSQLLWSKLSLFPGSRVGLMRADGSVQMTWPDSGRGSIYGESQEGGLAGVMQTNPGKVDGYFEDNANGNSDAWAGAYTHLSNANMVAYVSVPKQLILFRWWAHNYPVLVSFILYLAVIIVIAYWLAVRERRHTRELLAQSRKDTLTGLPNRLAADELIALEIARSRRSGTPFAVLYLDLEKFKDVNDGFGHASGDLLLQMVASRARGALRKGDILARLGGDEFFVLLPDSCANAASDVAVRLIRHFGETFRLEGQDIKVSASIGICLFPDNGSDGSSLLQNADAAMYEAKRKGENHFSFYAEEMGKKIRQHLELRRDLQRALESQEFVLHYQPLVDMTSGRIVGAEALVRWADPERGQRNPAEFIPVAEESGLILPLGQWVLNTACRQAKIWMDSGFDIGVAVNLSTRQFQDASLLSSILSILEETGLEPSGLELEVTESAAMLDPAATIQVLNKLKSLGLRIAIDDFGTGYSSLSYLKRIPADTIKIDKSFVSGIHRDADDLAIVRAVMALAKTLEKRCLAEGIETEEQFETLRKLGCHCGQGYWIGKPQPADEFEKMLRRSLDLHRWSEPGAFATVA